MRITVTIPTAQTPTLVSNVLGLAGLVGFVVSIGALIGSWWWSVLAGSIAAVAVAYVTHAHAQAETVRRVAPPAPAAAGKGATP